MLRLEDLRKQFGLSQLELANKLNMTQQRISTYEKGIREPDLETLKQFSDFFGVTIDYLIGKSDVRNPEEIDMNKVNVGFSSGAEALNEENKKIIESTIQALLAKQKLDEEKKKEK